MTTEGTEISKTGEMEVESVQRDGKYLAFRLVDEEYGIEILKAREIIGMMNITRVPKTPDFIRGVINLRGKIIPVMDLGKKFGMESNGDTDKTCIIVLDVERNGGTVQIGILVDSVSEVIDIKAADIEDPPPFGSQVDTDFLLGMGKVDRKVVMLLDVNRVMSDGELDLAEQTARGA